MLKDLLKVQHNFMAIYQPTEENRRQAYTDAGLAYDPAQLGGVINTTEEQKAQTSGVIKASDLSTPTTPINPVTPTYTNPTIPQIDNFTPAAPSTTETQISDIDKQIAGIEASLATDKPAFQAQETQRLGIEKLGLEEADLFSQLKQQKAEFENLTAEDTRIEERMQQQATGRGITAGGLQPLTAAELRKNFLVKSSKAAEFNLTAALLAGTQNKLLTAQSLIDRAVKNKFAGREAELDAKIKNREALGNSPLLTLEQKNRNDAGLARDKKEKEANDKKKMDATTILNWAIDAKKNGASALEAQQIANIGLSDNPDLASAFAIYSKYQKVETKDGFTLGEGQVRYDANGNVLATNRGVPGVPGGLSPITESVIQNPSLYYSFTPTEKAKIISELQAGGYDITGLQNIKLSSGQEDDIAQMNTVSNLIETVLNYNKDGKLEGIGSFGRGSLKSIGAQLGFGGEEGKSVRATIGNIKATIAKLRGGTSFTPNEERLLETYTPAINDRPDVAINKLINLKQFIAQKNADIIKVAKQNLTVGQIKKNNGSITAPTPESLRTKYNY